MGKCQISKSSWGRSSPLPPNRRPWSATSVKTYYDAINYLYDIIGIDFTERCHVLFTRATESLLGSARASCENVIC